MYDVLAVTGYKPHEIGVYNEKHEQLSYLKRAIQKKLFQLIDEFDIKWVVTSGQSGVELWAAEAALGLKEQFPGLKIGTLAPFYNQEERYADAVKVLYETVWEHSDYKDYITKRPYDSPAQLRMKNHFIVTRTKAALVLYDEATEGTPKFFLQEANAKQQKEHYPVFYLTPDDIEELIREEQDNEGRN